MYIDYDDSFDEILDEYENIKLLPFIGSDYNLGKTKTKIMVLGESAYWEKNDPFKETTRDNIFYYLEEIRPDGSTPKDTHSKPFRNTAAMISGKSYYKSDEKWKYLAFYNFYQFIIGKNANDKSLWTKENNYLSQTAFFDVIKILKPDFIIVWGVSYMYESWLPQEGRIFLDKEKKLYKFEAFPNTIIWHIQHPSRGFELEYWQEEYKAIRMFLN